MQRKLTTCTVKIYTSQGTKLLKFRNQNYRTIPRLINHIYTVHKANSFNMTVYDKITKAPIETFYQCKSQQKKQGFAKLYNVVIFTDEKPFAYYEILEHEIKTLAKWVSRRAEIYEINVYNSITRNFVIKLLPNDLI